MFPDIPTAGAGRVLTAVEADSTTGRTFPDLGSLTKSAGDLLIAMIYVYGGSVTSNFFGSWGAGFSEQIDAGDTLGNAIGIATKISDGTETGVFAVTQAGTPNGHAAMILCSIPNVNQGSPFSGGSVVTGTTTAADPASLSAPWGAQDNLWISFAGCGETSTAGSFAALNAAPTNYTTNFNVTSISADVVGGVQAGVAFRQLNAASENIGPWSIDTSNTRNAAVALVVQGIPDIVSLTMFGQSPQQFPNRSVLERRVW